MSGRFGNDLGRRTLLGLAVVVALLAVVTLALVGRDRIGRMFTHHKNDTPTIMIVSRQMLKSTVETNEQVDAAVQSLRASAPAKNTQDKSAAKPALEDGRTATQKQNSQLGVLISSMEDDLGGRVAEDFQDSGRFRLVPQAKVVDAMDAYARTNHIPPANLWQFVSGSVASQTRTNTSVSNQTAKDFSQGLTDVARQVNADFTLIVSMGEPSLILDQVDATPDQPAHFVMSAQPIINCEVFDAEGRYSYRFTKQLDHPIVESLYPTAGDPIKGEAMAAYNKLQDRVAAQVGRQVLEWTLDKIAPARIVSTDGNLVINRGSNDGFTQGAAYPVQREIGEDVREGDDGPSLGKVRKDVGSLVIQSVQDRIAIATPAAGEVLIKGDIVVVTPSQTGGVPAQAQAGAATGPGQTLNVAVDHVSLGGVESPSLAETVSAALAGDSRIAVLPRAELGNLASERARNARAGGDFGLSPDEGLRQSSYLVDGQCGSSSHRHDKTISIAGVSQTVSSSVTTNAGCTLRAVAVDGRLMGVAQGDGDTVQAAVQAAANALLAKILPGGSAGQPAVAPTPLPAPQHQAAASPPPAARHRPPPPKASSAKSDETGIHF